MQITVIATGTLGDVLPLLNLARFLREMGHNVRVYAQKTFASHTDSTLVFHPLSGDATTVFTGALGLGLRQRVATGQDLERFWSAYFCPVVWSHLLELESSCSGSDLVLCGPWLHLGPTLSEFFEIPCFVCCVMPVPGLSTSEFPYPFSTRCEWGSPSANRETWKEGELLSRIAYREVSHWRAEILGLEEVSWEEYSQRAYSMPHLFAYSHHLLPVPVEWQNVYRATGYWRNKTPYIPPRDLSEFLEQGQPPIVFGFSSQTSRRAAEFTATILAALRNVRHRGILLSGWGGLQVPTKNGDVFSIKYAPHGWLLSKAVAMVHHGGAGTLGECLHAGIPSLTVPLGYDEVFWGRLSARTGVGLPPIQPEDFNVTTLTKALSDMLENRELQHKCAEFAQRLSGEDGCSTASDVIHGALC